MDKFLISQQMAHHILLSFLTILSRIPFIYDDLITVYQTHFYRLNGSLYFILKEIAKSLNAEYVQSIYVQPTLSSLLSSLTNRLQYFITNSYMDLYGLKNNHLKNAGIVYPYGTLDWNARQFIENG
jgi:hypothetical protein